MKLEKIATSFPIAWVKDNVQFGRGSSKFVKLCSSCASSSLSRWVLVLVRFEKYCQI